MDKLLILLVVASASSYPHEHDHDHDEQLKHPKDEQLHHDSDPVYELTEELIALIKKKNNLTASNALNSTTAPLFTAGSSTPVSTSTSEQPFSLPTTPDASSITGEISTVASTEGPATTTKLPVDPATEVFTEATKGISSLSLTTTSVLKEIIISEDYKTTDSDHTTEAAGSMDGFMAEVLEHTMRLARQEEKEDREEEHYTEPKFQHFQSELDTESTLSTLEKIATALGDEKSAEPSDNKLMTEPFCETKKSEPGVLNPVKEEEVYSDSDFKHFAAFKPSQETDETTSTTANDLSSELDTSETVQPMKYLSEKPLSDVTEPVSAEETVESDAALEQSATVEIDVESVLLSVLMNDQEPAPSAQADISSEQPMITSDKKQTLELVISPEPTSEQKESTSTEKDIPELSSEQTKTTSTEHTTTTSTKKESSDLEPSSDQPATTLTEEQGSDNDLSTELPVTSSTNEQSPGLNITTAEPVRVTAKAMIEEALEHSMRLARQEEKEGHEESYTEPSFQHFSM